jgi:type I restriction enzyme R subunit
VTKFAESVVEDAALAWLKAIGWPIAHGPDIAPDQPRAERPIMARWCSRSGCATR